MLRCWLALILLWICTVSYSQKISLIHSGDLLKKARIFYDSGKYELSIQELLKIPERDTNYVKSQLELVRSFRGNKSYDKAIALSNTLLQKQATIHRNDLLLLRALSTKDNGEFQKAVELHEAAIKEFPTDMTLVYNLGITYSSNKDYEKAAEQFFKVLANNPYHSNAHLMLGRISIGQGRKVHGMLSLGMYLGINNTDNEKLILLNNFLDNQIPDEGIIPLFGVNATDKLDQVIKAKIAMEKKFNSKIPIDAAVVKQFELLFDQLYTISGTNDPWMNYYLPIYKEIKNQQAAETFIYHILSSAKNETAAKWRSKNEKQLQAFYTIANTELKSKREKMSVPQFGYTSAVKAWYRDDNGVEALGEKINDEKRNGLWIFFHPNNEKHAEGSYTNGEKNGTWKYYYNDSKIKSIENYTTGEVTVYDEQGNKSEHFFLKDDKIQGDVEVFYSCGPLKDKMQYLNGERHGKFETYYTDGTIAQRYGYDNGKLNGESVYYFDDGKIASKAIYKSDIANGEYKSYYSNGNVKEEGLYSNDLMVGNWEYYHRNGKLSKTGNYSSQGAGVGEWVYYDNKGSLDEKRVFDSEGRWTGDNLLYNKGVLNSSLTFKKDVMIKTTAFSPEGKSIASYGNSDGNFYNKFHFPSGELQSEGNYKKGKKEGLWKYYNRFGKLISTTSYKEGEANGPAKEYYASGEIKTEREFVNGQLHGYYIYYYRNSKIKQEGWFQDDKREQQWLNYYPDGTIQSDYYYLNDEVTGAAYDYALDGKKQVVSTYMNNRISDLVRYAMDGEVKGDRTTEGRHIIYKDFYPNNKARTVYQLTCGKYDGEFTRFLPDGSLYYKYHFKNGKQSGYYESWELSGVKSQEGNQLNDEQEGIWKSYHDNGTLYYTGKYDQGERDSTWVFYFDNAKISSITNYSDGERNGITRYFSPEGQPILEKLFDNNDLISYRSVDVKGNTGEWIKFSGTGRIDISYANGNPAWKEVFVDGVRDGTSQLFFANGNLFDEYHYNRGDYEGEYKEYYANGKLKERGTYKADELEGVREFFNEDGSLSKTENFRFGSLHGKVTLYTKGVVTKEFIFWSGVIEK